MPRQPIACFFAACLALGCTTTPTPADTGSTPGNDAGTDGGSTPVDSGGDAFVAPMPDGGGECHDDYAGCSTIEDHTGVATFTIAVPDSMFVYDHKCIRVDVGTVVTITNSTTHPLTAASCSTAGGPIPAIAAPEPGVVAAAHTDYTFDAAGHYGYYCGAHGADSGLGMAGLIIVE